MMTPGRFLRISPPTEGSKFTHQTSPRCIGVSDHCLGPFKRLSFASLVFRHLLVSGVEVKAVQPRQDKRLDELTYIFRSTDSLQFVVDPFVNINREFFLHDSLP